MEQVRNPIVKAIINSDVVDLEDVEKLIDSELENMPTCMKELIDQYGKREIARCYLMQAYQCMVEERYKRTAERHNHERYETGA